MMNLKELFILFFFLLFTSCKLDKLQDKGPGNNSTQVSQNDTSPDTENEENSTPGSNSNESFSGSGSGSGDFSVPERKVLGDPTILATQSSLDSTGRVEILRTGEIITDLQLIMITMLCIAVITMEVFKRTWDLLWLEQSLSYYL